VLLEEGDVCSRQAEVTDLQVAVTVDQKVLRLQISVEDVRTMDVLQATQDLVQEELNVLIGDLLL